MKHILADEFNKFIDKELAPQELEAMEKHLAECSFCADELKSFQSVHAQLMALPADTVSDKFETAVLARIARRIKSEKSQKTFIGFIFSLFGIGIAATIGFIGYGVLKTVIAIPQESESVRWMTNAASQVASLIQPLFLGKNLQSIEVTMILFFILSIYFLIEKFRTMRN